MIWDIAPVEGKLDLPHCDGHDILVRVVGGIVMLGEVGREYTFLLIAAQ